MQDVLYYCLMNQKINAFPSGVRLANLGDIPVLADLLAQLFKKEPDFTVDSSRQKRGLELMLEDEERNLVLVAEVEGDVIGMVTVQLNISTSEGGYSGLLEDLVVREDRQGQGWGSDLLASALEWSRKKGSTRVQLLADRNNQSALDFYTRKGLGPTSMVGRKILFP